MTHPASWADRFAVLLLIAQPLIFYRHVLFHPTKHIPFDIAGYHLPLASYVARCVREGVFPFWDPYPYAGVPIHADLTAQLYYPVTWVALLLGNLSAGHNLFYWIEWLDPVHMILGGLFAFLLLRSMGMAAPVAAFGGGVYQLGGFFASQAEHLGAICTGAWLPLMLLAVWKLSRGITVRWIALLGLAAALTILSGFTATASAAFGATAMWAIALSVARRPNWKLLAAVAGGLVLGVGITAVQLVPTYQLTGRSVASTRAVADSTGGGLRVQSLASLVVPNYYHIYTPNDTARYKLPFDFTFLYVYCGILPLLAVLAAPFLRRAPYARTLFVLTVISAVWMLGDETPVYRLVYAHLPRLVRAALYAEFALMAFSLFAALTAAAAFQRLAARAPAWLLWTIVLLTAFDLTHFGGNKAMNAGQGSYREWNNEYEIAGYPGALGRIHGLLAASNPPLRVDYLQRDVFAAATGAELLQLPTPDGDNPFALQRMVALRRLFGAGNFWERQLPVDRPESPLLGMLNVGFLAAIHQPGIFEDPRWSRLPLAAEVAGARLYRTSGVLPRFFLVRRVRLSSGEAETLADLARPDFAPADEAVVEAPRFAAAGPFAPGEVRVARYSANRVELKVTTGGRAFLASSEVLYPGWTATVNGRPASLYMTNGAFRGLLLDAGVNQIVMTYWPEGFAVWAAISAAFAGIAIAGIVFGAGPGDKRRAAAS